MKRRKTLEQMRTQAPLLSLLSVGIIEVMVTQARTLARSIKMPMAGFIGSWARQ
jgi:hypothetical protein